mmetsp:Transcript_6569/g.7622  ORF Transcript_6569/g.7622 Transcript_6569/m.7622 type:complete len:104 (+) Transcript_6569:134-445(+)
MARHSIDTAVRSTDGNYIIFIAINLIFIIHLTLAVIKKCISSGQSTSEYFKILILKGSCQASGFCDTLAHTLSQIPNPSPTVADTGRDYLEVRRNLRNAGNSE